MLVERIPSTGALRVVFEATSGVKGEKRAEVAQRFRKDAGLAIGIVELVRR